MLGKSTQTSLPLPTFLSERISRAGTVARLTFAMLFTAILIQMVPVEFACRVSVSFPDPIPDPTGCVSCSANGATYGGMYMVWALFGE